MVLGVFLAKVLSLTNRLVSGFIGVFITTLALPLIAQLFEESTSFPLIIVAIVIMGVFNSLVQGGVFGFAGIFPFKYTGAVMLGNGLSGLSMNFFRGICLLIFPIHIDGDDNEFYGCLVYFIIACVIVILCILGYFVSICGYFLIFG